MIKTKKSKLSSTLQKTLETYLFLPNLKGSEHKEHGTGFFDLLTDLDAHLEDCILFLNQQNALQYCNIIQSDSVVVKAFIPQDAFINKTLNLSLKKGVITKNHIHGCYFIPHKSKCYIENPHFDNQHFSLASNEFIS